MLCYVVLTETIGKLNIYLAMKISEKKNELKKPEKQDALRLARTA